MSDELTAYKEDPRTVCKYGSKCYQKNQEHHAKFKHPPIQKKVNGGNKRRFSPYSRDAKTTNITPTASSEQNTSVSPAKDNPAVSNKTDLTEEKPDFNVTLPHNLSFYDQNHDHKIFKELFLVDMPEDFFKFYECLNDDNCIEKTLAAVDLELIGPFDLLLGKLPVLDNKELYLTHWRFFYDPPEFQAVLKKKGASQYHIGYYRDEPDTQPVFMADNDSAKDCRITPVAQNIFGAVYLYLQNAKPSPFVAMAYRKLMVKIKKFADDNNVSLEKYDLKKRWSTVKTRTLHGAGITFPYNAKTELGYRRLAETDAKLRELFKKIQEAKSQDEKLNVLSELQPVITYATIAVDECDFGTGLEAGIALFCSGLKELSSSTIPILSSTYALLNRQSFAEIIKVHMKYRRRGHELSLLSLGTK